MENLTFHYKDRSPKETINIITNFFINKGYNINKISSLRTSAGTYYSNFALYWKNHLVMRTNGKGVSQELSEASGLAELYERFCATISEGWFVNKKIKDIYANREYKIISKKSFLEDEYTKAYLSIMLPENTEYYTNKYIKNFYNDNIYGNKYINLIDSNDILYKNEHMMFVTCGSTGLAAGNTLEEALVQGISEFYERLSNQYFFEDINNLNYEYFEIDRNILPKYLLDIIIEAEKNDFCEIHLFDLSYTFNLPAVSLVLRDLNSHNYYYCTGASPIFEIAAERCLTEVYQGLYHHNQTVKYITFPDETPWEEINSKQNVSHDTNLMFIPENLLFNSKIVNDYNRKIFLDNNKEYSNQEILKQIKRINKINNLEMYYEDISLTEQMKTIRVITKHYISKTCLIIHKKWANQYTKQKLAQLFEINNKIIEGYNFILENNPENLSNEQIEIFFDSLNLMIEPLLEKIELHKILTNFYNFHTELFSFYLTGLKSEDRLIYNNLLIWDIYNNNLKILKNNNTTLAPQVEKWFIVKKYLEKNYSKEKIQKILEFLNYKIELNEINNVDNIFILKEILKYLYNSYNNDDYYKYLKSFEYKKND